MNRATATRIVAEVNIKGAKTLMRSDQLEEILRLIPAGIEPPSALVSY